MRRAIVLSVLATACASAHEPMQRALDPSMERAARSERYLRAVGGITGNAARMTRGDGSVYLADVAPSMRFFVITGDGAAYLRMRRYVEASMIERAATGLQPARRVRPRGGFERATPYGVARLGDALALGWQAFGDTASAALAASLRADDSPTQLVGTESDQMVERCSAADASVRTDPGTARAVLGGARRFAGGGSPGRESHLDLRGVDGDLVALACLTRLALAVNDPDATVRFLDRLLDRLAPFLSGRGRPDPGAAAEVLLALREVRAAGPGYADRR